jgi:hypothetical protein
MTHIKLVPALLIILISLGFSGEAQKKIHVYRLTAKPGRDLYDEAEAAACIQGLVNRKGPLVYLVSDSISDPEYWLGKFTASGKWLAGAEIDTVRSLGELFDIGRESIKGAIIWDPSVPATINVATTIAGVEDGIVLSPELAHRYIGEWKLKVILDLRGMFTGAETGSTKNDAYRWAIKNYLEKGLCFGHRLFLNEDSYFARDRGDIGYIVTRDWAVNKRSFVFDLSPWGDEVPKDDPGQKPGTDLATYKMILDAVLKQTAGKEMTEISGFFVFSKYANMPDHRSSHEPVPTEWESVYLMSPYNCYQNTVASYCFNESFHSQAPSHDLKQHKPVNATRLENKIYICIFMADYDSGTCLYSFLKKFWEDKNRGVLPFLWGLNPNLIETYPDIIEYFYESLSPNDYFGSDASAAGYFNPNRIQAQYIPLFIEHNRKFFSKLDMTIAPMVLDWSLPSTAVKDAFHTFAPDGLGTIVYDFHANTTSYQPPEVWNGMPVMELHNETGGVESYQKNASTILDHIGKAPADKPSFYLFRIVWTSPSDVLASIKSIKEQRPDLDFEVVDPYTFKRLFREYYSSPGKP